MLCLRHNAQGPVSSKRSRMNRRPGVPFVRGSRTRTVAGSPVNADTVEVSIPTPGKRKHSA